MNLHQFFSAWSEEDRANLGFLLDSRKPLDFWSPECLQETIWSLFNKDSAVYARWVGENTRRRFSGQETISVREAWEKPDYETLLKGACEKLACYEEGAATEELEAFLTQKLLVRYLATLSPRERLRVFDTPVQLSEMEQEAGVRRPSLAGEAGMFAAFSIAQASGFGVYMAASTLLGSVTSAVGLTLPFAVYTGMSATIATIIGPIGWAALGASAIYKTVLLSEPEWQALIRPILYIISVRTRPEFA